MVQELATNDEKREIFEKDELLKKFKISSHMKLLVRNC